MRKIEVIVAGVSTLVDDKLLTQKVIGQDENSNDILGDYHKNYNADMTVDVATEDALSIVALIANFKSLYLGIVDAKLKELDYDSLATVKLWEGDVGFGDEATQILTWYKAIIAKNYEILNSGVVPTEAEYLDEINGIIF